MSHPDKDHCNLLNAVIKYLSNAGIETSIFDIDPSSVKETELLRTQNFFERYGIYTFTLIPIFSKSHSTNDRTIILKVVICNNWNKSILFTGDATKKTYDSINAEQVILYGDDNNKSIIVSLCHNLFADVVCFMPAHHASATEGSLIWTENVLCNSKFPVLTVISSDPKTKNHIPTFTTVSNIVKMSSQNLLLRDQDLFCVGHCVDCYSEDFSFINESMNDEVNVNVPNVIKYPACYVTENNTVVIVPVFVTCNALHPYYSITIDQNNNNCVMLWDGSMLMYCWSMDYNNIDYGFWNSICRRYLKGLVVHYIDEMRTLYNKIEPSKLFTQVYEVNEALRMFNNDKKKIINNLRILGYIDKFWLLSEAILSSMQCYDCIKYGDDFYEELVTESNNIKLAK